MSNTKKMKFNATWSMAVGGMVGGGIFSVLGVIIGVAGQWAWLSFIVAGLIALISAYSYSQLTIKFQKEGGSFTFLNQINHEGAAGSLAWILILGYILTISVYAFTFGHYVAHVFSLGSWFPRALAFFAIAALALVNLRGVGDSSRLEIITVWGKLFVLLGLALIGLYHWQPEALNEGVRSSNWLSALTGAAIIFMAYEGFQLLSYDYSDIHNPKKTLPRATIIAVLSVIIIYVLVAVGATMLVGAETLIEKKEIALSIAGQKALGTTGLFLVTIAAAFSTGSAINATLFSTARLMETVAEKKDLPHIFLKENDSNIPYYAIISVAILAALLAVLGSLDTLVDAASLVFLITFGTVNFIAFLKKIKYWFICIIGSISCLAAIVISAYQQYQKNPFLLIGLIALVLLTFILRPVILKKIRK